MVTLELPLPHWEGDTLHCAVSYIDNFGNLRLNVSDDDIARWSLREGDQVKANVGGRGLTAPYLRSFGAAPEGATALIMDSYWRLMLAINRGNAAITYGVAVDAPVTLAR